MIVLNIQNTIKHSVTLLLTITTDCYWNITYVSS